MVKLVWKKGWTLWFKGDLLCSPFEDQLWPSFDWDKEKDSIDTENAKYSNKFKAVSKLLVSKDSLYQDTMQKKNKPDLARLR